MDTTRTDAIESTWMMSFGYLEPPPDSRRITVVEPEIKKPSKPIDSYKSKMLVKSPKGIKLRRGIFALLRAGIDDHIQVYDLLFYRGFINEPEPGKRGSGISKREFFRYLSQAMVHLRIPKKTKSYLIIKKHEAGKEIGEIAKELCTNRTYVRMRLIESGLIEKLPVKVAKHTQAAWSKRSIK